ncbi:preprotein translocase subunit YajC [Thalassospira alkalitolerans]|uniref:preprotein translocase subunit YajC n=1 Tax=Thalassospira alkalitolerans TaxID=1293890 RepID=UPI003AA8165F|tara:strand:- start:13801 stop:14184 length:384 start_codon:yes stop_codon:yes gene_type:complete
MLISPAYAQGIGGAGGADMLTSFLPLILIFVVFYFLLIRPQQKKQKEHKAMLASVRRGDKIVTAGGLIGTVAKVIGDDELSVEIAEGVKVKVARGMVSTVLSKTEPAKGDDKDEKEEKEEAEEPKKD